MESQKQPSAGRSRRWAVPFFTIWTGQAFSMLGSHIVQFALVWYLTQKTGSATVLSMATLSAMLPQILLSPFAGALVDRWNRRYVMMAADSGIALVTLWLIYQFASGNIQVWHIFLVMLLRSAGGAFHWPAMQASTALMVPEENLSRVSGMNQTLFGIMGVASPALGAMFIKLLPMHGVLSIDIATAVLAVAPLCFIAVPQPQQSPEPQSLNQKDSVWSDVQEGFRYVWNWQGLMVLMVFAAFLNLLITPTYSLLPLLVTRYFNGDVFQLGLINSAEGIGMVVGGVILSIWGGFKRRIVTTLPGLIGMGIGIICTGMAPSHLFTMALAGMLLAGFMSPMVNGPVFAIIQTVVDPAKQGRVMSLLNTITSAMTPLGLIIAGPVSDSIGIRVWYIAAGLFCLVMGFSGFFIRSVMTLEEKPGIA